MLDHDPYRPGVGTGSDPAQSRWCQVGSCGVGHYCHPYLVMRTLCNMPVKIYEILGFFFFNFRW